MIFPEHLLLSLFLALWCFFHSILISRRFLAYAEAKLGKHFRAYRILYNLFSLLSFLPILIYSYTIESELFFSWSGSFQAFRIILFLICFLLYYAGSKSYDLYSFLGFRQIQRTEHHKTITKNGELSTLGILRFIRHPWYTATFIFIWSRNMDMSALIVNVILSIYLVVGCFLEEKKLLIEYGSEYRNYQQNVSMLFPWKWLKTKLIR